MAVKQNISFAPNIKANWRIALFLLIGVVVRLIFVARSDYPLGEGGLFYYVIQYIADNGELPVEIPFYSCGVPFVYPPLGFVLYAFIIRCTSITLLTLMRWGSFFFSCIALFVFVLLARRFLQGLAWEFAVLSFATMPSIAWHTTASDSIRNLAFVLLLGSLFFSHKALTEDGGGVWTTVAAGVLAGLTVLVHPPAAMGLLLVVALFTTYYGLGQGYRRFLVGATIFGLAALVTAPWFLVLYKSHGPGFVTILRNGFSSRPHATIWLFSLLQFGPTREPYAHLWAVLGIIGIIYGWVSNSPLLALWFLIAPLHWSDHIYSLPLAMGAGLSIGEIIVPRIRKNTRYSQRLVAAILLCAIVVYTMINATAASGYCEMQPQVTDARLEAWDWMAHHLGPDSWVTIVGEEKEWVPAFAHVCANIPQGAEWTGRFIDYAWMYNALVAVPTYDELIQILRHYDQPVEYLYVSVPPSSSSSWESADGEIEYRFESEALRRRLAFRRSVEQQDCATQIFSNAEVVLYDLRGCVPSP